MGAATEAIKRRMAAQAASPAASSKEDGRVAERVAPDDEEERVVPFREEELMLSEQTPFSLALRKVASVEVETVIGNALVRVRFERGTNPAEVLDLLHLFDANAQVRAEFPSKGFGPRETKTAPLTGIAFKKNGVTLTCDLSEDESFNLDIWSDKVKAFTDKLKTCPLLTEKHLAKIAQPKDGDAIKAEKLGITVKYSQSGEKRFFEDLVIETPKDV